MAGYSGKVITNEAQAWMGGEVSCAEYYAGVYVVRLAEAEQDITAKLAARAVARQVELTDRLPSTEASAL